MEEVLSKLVSLGQGAALFSALKHTVGALTMRDNVLDGREERAKIPLEPAAFVRTLTKLKGDQRWLLKHVADKPDVSDINTPDYWVPRHPSLIRLDKPHPLNCEPHLSDLMECGAITPSALHYVENRGAVPNIDWNLHRIRVVGDVRRHLSISMKQLTKMKSITLPVLLVSGGNRRKELNMMRKTIGADSGAAGLGNSLWTGVPLRTILQRAGVDRVTAQRKFVCFHGLESKTNDRTDRDYGTSIPLSKALDPEQDVIIAFMQNGKKLSRDQGYPARIIIPGHVGGRSIKWLNEIEVTHEPCRSYYHLHDNRVFPPRVTAELAVKENWWGKSEHLFNELNVNSVISTPAQGEALKVTAMGSYVVKGYAYSGGGRSVTRVEVSLDGGISWRLTKLCHPCPPTAYGKQWCWAHWSIEVKSIELTHTSEIICRAWDESNNTQPRDMTWNILGIGNNAYFRVKCQSSELEGATWVRFEHPTEPADMTGGWMGSQANGWQPKLDDLYAPRAVSAESASIYLPRVPKQATTASEVLPLAKSVPEVSNVKHIPPPPGGKFFSLAEVEKHDSDDDAWIIVNGKVYDVTEYLAQGLHPGGNASIVMNAGTDSTEDFEAVHSAKAWKQLDDFLIGYLEPTNNSGASVNTSMSTADVTITAPVHKLPEATGPVNLLQFALDHPEMYGDTLVGEAAEAAAFDRMWAGACNEAGNAPVALDPKKWLKLVCDAKVPLSHDTILLRLKLESEHHQCGLPVGYHLYLRGERAGKKFMRAYTPSSLNGTLGAVEFVIKIYFPNDNPRFPEGGQLTRYLNSVNVGDFVEVKGPMGHIKYEGCGRLIIDKAEINVDRMTMIGGGTGVAPMLQMIVAVLSNPKDETKIKFLFGNKSEKDILLRYTLDRLMSEHPGRFEVHYTVSKVETDSWDGLVGRVNKDMIEKCCFPCDSDGKLRTVALLCGPPSLEEDTCIPALKELGYPMENIIRY